VGGVHREEACRAWIEDGTLMKDSQMRCRARTTKGLRCKRNSHEGMCRQHARGVDEELENLRRQLEAATRLADRRWDVICEASNYIEEATCVRPPWEDLLVKARRVLWNAR
jgi:hypothetical protein